MEDKNRIRKAVLERRALLTDGAVEEKSGKILKKLTALPVFQKSQCVLCYVSFRNEVATRDLLEHCLALGKKTAVPFVAARPGGKKEMVAVEIHDPETDLVPGTYGILEPRRGAAEAVDPREIDLVVVPGVAFDREKNRIGFGAGYYDRFLRKVREDCEKVGVAYEFQIFDGIPAETHDVPLDRIITENRIL